MDGVMQAHQEPHQVARPHLRKPGRPLVFLSYCVCDTGNKRGGDSTAYKVKAALEDDGFNVFMDCNLEGGDDWNAVINDNVQNADAMIALSSKHFAQLRPPGMALAGTSWTMQEVRAFMKTKPTMLFPVLHSGSWPPRTLFLDCNHIEEVKLSMGFEPAMARLVASLRSKLW